MRTDVRVHVGWNGSTPVFAAVEVEAYATVTPGLVVHRMPEWDAGSVRVARAWNLTHAPSGLALAVGRSTRRECLELAARLGGLGIDWTQPEPQADDEVWAEVARICWRGRTTAGGGRLGARTG